MLARPALTRDRDFVGSRFEDPKILDPSPA